MHQQKSAGGFGGSLPVPGTWDGTDSLVFARVVGSLGAVHPTTTRGGDLTLGADDGEGFDTRDGPSQEESLTTQPGRGLDVGNSAERGSSGSSSWGTTEPARIGDSTDWEASEVKDTCIVEVCCVGKC